MSITSATRAVRSGVVDEPADRRLVVRHAAGEHLDAARGHRAGVVVAFGYIDADEHLDADGSRI